MRARSFVLFEVEDLLEGFAEVFVKEGVQHGVERGVCVAEPDDEGRGVVVQMLTVLAQAAQHVHECEGHPADKETCHDQQHPLGGALLPHLEPSAHAGGQVIVAFHLPREG